MCWPIYTPSTLAFEGAGLCGSAEEFKLPGRSYPINHYKKNLVIHDDIHMTFSDFVIDHTASMTNC
jgi:hypothetical protein